MDSRDLVEHELAAMAADRGDSAAQMARVAWELVTREGGPEAFTQLRVQEFCWDTLVTNVEGTQSARWDFVCALAQLLDRLGLRRYAEIARGPHTREIVEAAEDGEVAASVVREAAWRTSGVRPADTDLLTWGTEQGPGERYAFEEAAGALEMALLAGDLRPQGPGWQKAAGSITRHVLTSPQEELRGKPPLPGILEERFYRWAPLQTPRRQELLFSLGPALTAAETAFDQVPVDQLGPLRYVLDGGRAALPVQDAEKVAERSVLDVALRLGLVVRRGEHLLTTDAGRAALKSQVALASAFARWWVGSGADVVPVVRELVAALLLAGAATVQDLVDDVVGLLAESGWRRGDDGPLTATEVEPAVLETWEELLDLGLLGRPGWTLVLPDGAEPLLRECLRQRLAHIDLPSPRLC